MLDAHDKLAVLVWSERQLGDSAKRAAIVEVGGDPAYELVEKSVTGLQQPNCEPFLSVMADSIQRLSESRIRETNLYDRSRGAHIKGHGFAVH